VPLLNCGQTTQGTFYLNLSGNSADSTIVRAKTTITVLPKATRPAAARKITSLSR
jgi:hypothetical protein